MSLHELLRASAELFPDRPAVLDSTGATSYRDLDTHSDGLARRLAGLGVSRGDRVVVWGRKSADTVAAMQAVLRSGAAYVPVDGTAPAERVARVVGDCGAPVVFVDPSTEAPAREALDPSVVLVGTADTAPGDGADCPPARVRDDELAYILYTSGSTGAPKGVSVSHGASRAFVDWAAETFSISPTDRLANHASFAFDLSVLDLYCAFSAGAAVRLIPEREAAVPALLVEHLRRDRISVWYSVPSALVLMMREGGLLDHPAPDSLRAVLFAGEPFPTSQLSRLAAWTRAPLYNLYGPTETNVCAFHEVDRAALADGSAVPIGRAACGDRLRVLTDDGSPAAPGEVGELVVEGPTVMSGYWGRAPQHGPYSTGDLVRPREDGALDFVGRRDQMVKVRGYRVELGEVEAALASHPGLEEAVVVLDGSGWRSRLVAHVVARPGERPGPLSLRRHLARGLPPYMIPDLIRVVETLPRTANGKVDRRRIVSADL